MADQAILAALARLEEGQLALQTGQASLRADFLAELGKMRADIMERTDRLQSRLEILDDHLTMGLGNADRVERQVGGVAEQNRLLGEQLMTLHKIVRRLEGRINGLEERR